MLAWRIAKAPFALDRLGTGARLTGGRWNSPGVAVIYAALEPATAALEKLVHTGELLPVDLQLVRIDLPDDQQLYKTASLADLPKHWDEMPSSVAAGRIGDEFIRQGEKLGLIVPSAIVPEAQNIILNPNHSAMTEVHFHVIRAFRFDSRLRRSAT